MSVQLKKVLARMSPEMRATVEADAARVIAEELLLRGLRKAKQGRRRLRRAHGKQG